MVVCVPVHQPAEGHGHLRLSARPASHTPGPPLPHLPDNRCERDTARGDATRAVRLADRAPRCRRQASRARMPYTKCRIPDETAIGNENSAFGIRHSAFSIAPGSIARNTGVPRRGIRSARVPRLDPIPVFSCRPAGYRRDQASRPRRGQQGPGPPEAAG